MTYFTLLVENGGFVQSEEGIFTYLVSFLVFFIGIQAPFAGRGIGCFFEIYRLSLDLNLKNEIFILENSRKWIFVWNDGFSSYLTMHTYLSFIANPSNVSLKSYRMLCMMHGSYSVNKEGSVSKAINHYQQRSNDVWLTWNVDCDK